MNIVVAGPSKSGKTFVALNIYTALEESGVKNCIVNLSHYGIYKDYLNELTHLPLIDAMKRPENISDAEIDIVELRKEDNFIYYSSVFNSDAISLEQVSTNLELLLRSVSSDGRNIIIETDSNLLNVGTYIAFEKADIIYYVIDESIESFKLYRMLEELLMKYEGKIKLIMNHYKNKLELDTNLDIALRIKTARLPELSFTNRKIKKNFIRFVMEENLVKGETSNDLINRTVFKWPWKKKNSFRAKGSSGQPSTGKTVRDTARSDERYNL